MARTTVDLALRMAGVRARDVASHPCRRECLDAP